MKKSQRKGATPIPGKKSRWKEYDEDEHKDVMDTNEVQALVQSCGLPHLTADAMYESMQVVPPHPEVEESKDYIHE